MNDRPLSRPPLPGAWLWLAGRTLRARLAVTTCLHLLSARPGRLSGVITGKAQAEANLGSAARGQRFYMFMAAVVRRLPFGLSGIVPPSLVGFALINGFTFAVDLGLLTVFRSGFGWPVPVGITLSYLLAFALSFLLNRSLNFRSNAPVGRQIATYLVAIAINYLVCIIGVGAGLAALGLEYHVARVTAGVCEAVFMYSVMRWAVFRDTRHRRARSGRRITKDL